MLPIQAGGSGFGEEPDLPFLVLYLPVLSGVAHRRGGGDIGDGFLQNCFLHPEGSGLQGNKNVKARHTLSRQ